MQAEFGGKNDLLAGGRKIAGLGMYLDGHGGLLFHTSLLVDLDVDFMLQVLRIPAAKLADKGAAAVAERVTTVRRELGRPVDMGTLRERGRRGFRQPLRDDGLPPTNPTGPSRRPRMSWSRASTHTRPGSPSRARSRTAPAAPLSVLRTAWCGFSLPRKAR